ncbi:Protein of unknown function [Bacillus wiedmannii]|uniref:Uncharacterized protein n=2 Tax=Bacillus cereus group TaxID=86661 RepID=A0A1C4AKI7_BACTU|nr:Protein of unknown function [Bacillus wiedmannii]SCB95214.1 Protein of unknown function [Bacillus thuringiensis]SCL85615.1 Protein of unknown function [Bacillus wiedmannii]SCN05333.1 Protein of unknown function [Bacillus wiedmannii]SCN31015.1 Protein of unknown function [Bacillus wiedmannii]
MRLYGLRNVNVMDLDSG